MKRKGMIILSMTSMLALYAQETELGTIDVETTVDQEVVKNVSGEDIKSADLAEALFKQSPSVSLVRRSGISNDVIIRGLKKDNINVTIDGAKAYGAGPNRMDPPISHVLTNNIDRIEMTEGPYNVEDFGVLGADVKIITREPKEGFGGEVSANIGSFGYKKGALVLWGGSEQLRMLLSLSKEQGGQYKDGNGDDFVAQQQRYIMHHSAAAGLAYLPQYASMDAFEKKTLFTKLDWHIDQNQKLRFSYTRNRSKNILYPNTPMDALAVDDDLYHVSYTINNLGKYSKELTLSAYYSDIYHPMSNDYRKKSLMMPMAHKLTDKSKGVKLKNSFVWDKHKIKIGLDYNERVWDGGFYRHDMPLPPSKFHSIWSADTKDFALFVADRYTFGKWQIDTGARYDISSVATDRPGVKKKNYNGLSLNMFTTYRNNERLSYFFGLGRASRVPDGKELFFHKPTMHGSKEIGDPTLKKVVNTEADAGIEYQGDDWIVKAKLFYSDLQDDILYNATSQRYVNADATIWGIDLSGSYVATESLYVDYGLAYQRGKKKHPLAGQSDTDLPEIPPLKLNLALNYDYDESLSFKVEGIYSAKWSHYDADNGEQALGSYAVLNLKGIKRFGKHLEWTVGVDNLFDRTFVLSNTYKDQTLIAGGGDVMLMNEPGRCLYTNLKYRF